MKNKLITALLSVAIAFGLWLYVITVVSPGSEARIENIPVVLEGATWLAEERGLMVTSKEIPTVTLELSGNRTDLNKLNAGNITIRVDLTKISDPGKHSLNYNITYPGDVPESAVTRENQSPDQITLNVEKKVSVPVRVQTVYTGTVPEGYHADTQNAVLDYQTIRVTGPESIVGRIDSARVEVDLEGLTESFNETFDYTLCDSEGEPVEITDADQVEVEVEQVNLALSIQQVKEIPLTLNVIYGGGATEENCRIEIDPKVIQVRGSEEVLQDLNELSLGDIDLTTVLEDTEFTFDIELPEGVTSQTGEKTATVNVTFPSLRVATFTATNIIVENVPEGLEAEIVTKQLEVMVRGPRSQVNNMMSEDIIVVVDLSEGKLGSLSYNATIRLASKFSDVGAVGTLSVNVKLSEPEDGN